MALIEGFDVKGYFASQLVLGVLRLPTSHVLHGFVAHVEWLLHSIEGELCFIDCRQYVARVCRVPRSLNGVFGIVVVF